MYIGRKKELKTRQMKVTVNNKEENTNINYPCLMVSDELIVLFKGYGRGVVLRGDLDYSLAENSTAWDMDVFKPFKGSITLSND